MEGTSLPPAVSKVMVYRLICHFAVRVKSAVTGVSKSHSLSPLYQPMKVCPSLVGLSGWVAGVLARIWDATSLPPSDWKVTV